MMDGQIRHTPYRSRPTAHGSHPSDLMVAEEILERFSHYRTCSIANLREECVTYVVRMEMLNDLRYAPDALTVIVPRIDGITCKSMAGRPVEFYEAEDPAYTFARIHNTLNAHRTPAMLRIDETADIHPAAVLGPDGLKHVKNRRHPTWPVIRLKHMGSVVIERGAQIGPKSVVHRALFDETRIEENAAIGSLCNIGHNVQIGEGSMLTAGIMVGGSATIGPGCWIGMGAVILNQVSICPGVRIGAGSVVTRDIDRPGLYMGGPAKYVRQWDGRWDT